MKRFVLLSLAVILFAGLAYGADNEFKFRKSILYTITYLTGENTAKILEDVYFRELWDSEAIEKAPQMMPSGDVYYQTKNYIYAEFLKVYKDGKKESFLMPLKNIVEIKMTIATGFDAGSSSSENAPQKEELEMSIK